MTLLYYKEREREEKKLKNIKGKKKGWLVVMNKAG